MVLAIREEPGMQLHEGDGEALARVLADVVRAISRGSGSDGPGGAPPAPTPGTAASKFLAFEALTAPGISVEEYLARIVEYAPCSRECYVLTLIYIDRLLQANPQLRVNNYNAHRLLLISVMVAAKFLDDTYYNNKCWAKLGGCTNTEVNSLELCFLALIGFDLVVPPALFETYSAELCKRVAGVAADADATSSPHSPASPLRVAPYKYPAHLLTPPSTPTPASEKLGMSPVLDSLRVVPNPPPMPAVAPHFEWPVATAPWLIPPPHAHAQAQVQVQPPPLPQNQNQNWPLPPPPPPGYACLPAAEATHGCYSAPWAHAPPPPPPPAVLMPFPSNLAAHQLLWQPWLPAPPVAN